MSDSPGNFVRDAFQELQADDAATMIVAKPRAVSSLGALPGHEVEDFIARGGMGAVYRAKQCALEREVAVKVMTRDAGSAETAARFRREALVLGRLAHPNIVPVYNIGTDEDGQLYYTMKLVKGRTLQHILNDLRREDADTLRQHTLSSLTIFRKVCDALAFAHSQGILHRDLKPENVMVGEFGEVLVMDWGLAKMKNDGMSDDEPHSSSSPDIRALTLSADSDSESLKTLDGAVMGTPQYMSPEQALGQIDELDERSDVFSLGGILYAILTLRPPVEGKTLDEVLSKVRTAEITSPSEMQSVTGAKGKAKAKGDVLESKLVKPLPHAPSGRVPAALSSVVMKALRLDKSQRYPSVAELSADIEKFQGGFATSAEQAGTLKQLKLLMLRHKAVTASLAAMVLLSAAFMVKVMASERRAVANEHVATEALADSERNAAKAQVALADAALREGDGLAMQAVLAKVPEHLRDHTWHYLTAESDQSISPASLRDIIMGEAAPDPARPGVFAVSTNQGRVIMLNVRTGKRFLEFDPGFEASGKIMTLAFSPDGLRLALSRRRQGGIQIHDVRSGKLLRRWDSEPGESLAWGQGDRLLRMGQQSLDLWDASTAQMVWQKKKDHHILHALFTPDRHHILMYSTRDRLQLVAAADGSIFRNLGGREEGVKWTMVIHPDGKTAFVAANDGIECVDLTDGRLLFKTSGDKLKTDRANRVAGLGITPDGAALVTAHVEGDTRAVTHVWSARNGDYIGPLLGDEAAVFGIAARKWYLCSNSVSIHPVSGEVVMFEGQLRAWEAVTTKPMLEFSAMSRDDVVFWGQDHFVFGALKAKPWGLHRIGQNGSEMIWTPSFVVDRANVSRDYGYAAVFRAGCFEPIRILQEPSAPDEVGNIKLSRRWPQSVRVSPGGRFVLSRGLDADFGFEVFERSTGRTLPPIDEGGFLRLRDADWLGGEQFILGLVTVVQKDNAAQTEDRLIVWDVLTGTVVKSVNHSSAIRAFAISPDGQQIAEAGDDMMIRIRDADALEVRHEFRAHNDSITGLSWHPVESSLASVSADFTVRQWSLPDARLMRQWKTGDRGAGVRFSPSGKLLCVFFEKTQKSMVWQTQGGAIPAHTAWASAHQGAGTFTATPKLLSPKDWTMVRFSSESEQNQKLARYAIDDDPETIWHSRWMGEVAKPPHELVIDFGAERKVHGFLYLARSELSPNVAKDIEFTLSNDSSSFTAPPVKAMMKLVREPQITNCSEIKGRYLRVRILSSQDGKDFASAAEIGVIGE
jgi:serine/threonine protein kinase/WD40 repeat protein